jgi:hypothetical protein
MFHVKHDGETTNFLPYSTRGGREEERSMEKRKVGNGEAFFCDHCGRPLLPGEEIEYDPTPQPDNNNLDRAWDINCAEYLRTRQPEMSEEELKIANIPGRQI